MKQFSQYLGETLLVVKGGLLFLIGPLNAQLSYVAIAILIDLIFGICVAVKKKTFSAKVFTVKVTNKFFVYVAWIAMFHALDMVAGLPSTARNSVLFVLVSMEIVSASKNTAKLGYGKLASMLENVYFLLQKENPAEKISDDNQDDEGGIS
jgi:phage-related holin